MIHLHWNKFEISGTGNERSVKIRKLDTLPIYLIQNHDLYLLILTLLPVTESHSRFRLIWTAASNQCVPIKRSLLYSRVSIIAVTFCSKFAANIKGKNPIKNSLGD